MFKTKNKLLVSALITLTMCIGFVALSCFSSSSTTVYADNEINNAKIEYYAFDDSKHERYLTSTSSYKIVTSETKLLNGGCYVVLGDVTINERIETKNNPTLILGDNATLTIKGGIHVGQSSSFLITCEVEESGSLIISDVPDYCAGIGGDDTLPVENITICGGNINVTGGFQAAGIGSASEKINYIIIAGGVINTIGGRAAAGIGTGESMDGHLHNAVNYIIVYDGIVNAAGGRGAPGIGGGSRGQANNIFLFGGEIYAYGGFGAPAIGCGNTTTNLPDSLSIENCIVELTGGDNCNALLIPENKRNFLNFNCNTNLTINVGKKTKSSL